MQRVRSDDTPLTDAILEAVPQFIACYDAEGRCVFLNPAAHEALKAAFDAPDGDLLGLTPREWGLAPDVAEQFDTDRHQVAATGRSASGSLRISKSDWVRYYQYVLTPLFASGEGRYVLATMQDITERVELEEALRERERRHFAFTEHLPFGVYVVDAAGDLVYANALARGLLGGDVPERVSIQSLPERYLAYLAGTERLYPADRQPIARALRGERDAYVEDMELRRGGRRVPIEVWANPITDAEGKILFAIAVFRDVTERVEAQRAVAVARTMAERANDAKTEFLSRMSHELRTPLNAILGFGQLLELSDDDPKHLESVSQILKAGRHLLAMIDEVLDISRIEAGALSLSLEPVPVDGIVREVLGFMGPIARQHDVNITVSPDRELGSHVEADRQRLKQILLNLVSNAVKYNQPGGEVTVAWSRQGERLRIDVRDSGIGIAPHLMADLFRPFERLGVSSEVEGTGLGLALSRRLAEAMGGHLEAHSEVGKGSVFSVELPAAADPVGSRGDEGAQGELNPALAPTDTQRTTGTLLYVEDNVANVRLMERIVALRPGVVLVTAPQGRLALDLALELRPSVVLLDLHLPDMPGEEVLRRLQADPRTRDARVIVVSADALPTQTKRLLALGAVDYVTKPFEVSELLRVLDTLLRE